MSTYGIDFHERFQFVLITDSFKAYMHLLYLSGTMYTIVELVVPILKYGLADFVVYFQLYSVSKKYDKHLMDLVF